MIRKAIIPIAGAGSRLRPITSVLPKAMVPLPAGPQALVPVLHWICAEAAFGGVSEVLLIVSPAHRSLVADYLAAGERTGERTGGSLAGPAALPDRIEIAVQANPAGFGDAVAMGRDFVGDDDFMLLLGDHVYLPDASAGACAAQLADAHSRARGPAMIAVQPVGLAEIAKVGVPAGEPIGGRLYRCRDFVEKPDPATAAERLVTPGLADGQFLAHCGIYIFSPEIFGCLAELAARPGRGGNELQLADAQSLLLERHRRDYYLFMIAGRGYDTGSVDNYVKAVAAFAEKYISQGQRTA